MLQTAPPQAGTPDSLVTDTLALSDRIRADTAWVGHVTDPAQTVKAVGAYLRERFLDPSLWIGFIGLVLRVIIVAAVAVMLIQIIDRVARSYSRRFEHLPALHPRRQRVGTVTDLLRSAARYIIWPLALITILGQIGVELGALIATAGVAGVAVGFGAQTLVRDVISGIFLLFDDTLHIGDLVRIGSDEGTVEHIGVRLIKVRRYSGELMMVPAGELRIFGNRSIGFARAVVDVNLGYEQPTAPVVDLMRRVAGEWAETHRDVMLQDAPDVQAILSFNESTVTARIAVQTLPGEQWGAERDLRMRLKEAFEAEGIGAPFPRRTLYVQNTEKETAVQKEPGDEEQENPGE